MDSAADSAVKCPVNSIVGCAVNYVVGSSVGCAPPLHSCHSPTCSGKYKDIDLQMPSVKPTVNEVAWEREHSSGWVKEHWAKQFPIHPGAPHHSYCCCSCM